MLLITDRGGSAIASIIERGHRKYADFHSLRHTFFTRAWSTGATPDVVRALARHCDINLTLKYTHATPAAQADAMRKMPGLPGN